MAYGETRRFCCRVPVRYGVTIFSVLGMLGAGLTDAVLLLGILKRDQLFTPTTSLERIADIVLAVLLLALVFISIFGLVGAAKKDPSLVSSYSQTLRWHFALIFASGTFWVVTFFLENNEDFVARCKGVNRLVGIAFCDKNPIVLKYVVVGLTVLGWMAEFLTCVLVSQLEIQLLDEKERSKLKTLQTVKKSGSFFDD
ncbi:hypothetical protein BD410DRAFT_389449 [Rickenella mellea]|uniref:MARVEL domain-containing protein n=1 Tax=Rickenella mellea TaxID=50990 RepID=A0A4Y7PZI7_9AGAM|nr:hypothetical protein BD410DRAFT_389449 [Rickenella mellea]